MWLDRPTPVRRGANGSGAWGQTISAPIKAQPLLAASLVQIAKHCGRRGCRCQPGEKHVGHYITFSEGGKTRTVYAPVDREFTRSMAIRALNEAEGVERYGPLAPRQTKHKKQGPFGAEAFELVVQGEEKYLRGPAGELLGRVQGPHQEHGSMYETFRRKA